MSSPLALIRTLILLVVCQNLYATTTVQIHLQGIQGELLNNVLTYLSLEQQKNHPRLSEYRIRRLHKLAPFEIQEALRPFGYYQVQVRDELLPPTSKQPAWQANYMIKLGVPLKVKAVQIHLQGEGQQDEVFHKLLKNFPLKTGDVWTSSNYEKSKSLLRSLAEERGYFDAQWIATKVTINEPANVANILLSLDTQQRHRFGQVTFKQNTFDQALLEKFLTFAPGDFYTGSQLLAFQNALTNSNYFKQVEVALDKSSPTVYLPITVTLEPQKPSYYATAIGYGTDTGVRGSLGWEWRYINRYGHTFSAKAELSEIRQSATAVYHLPRGQIGEKFVSISSGYKDESTNTSDSRLVKLGISQTHPRSLFGAKLREVVGLEYRDEQYTVGSDQGHSKLLMPNLSWSYLQADDRLYTLHGYKLQLDLRGAVDGIGSNTSFIQTRWLASWIHQLHARGRLIARGEVGYSLISLLAGEFHDLPPSIRFFAGGDRSVRGYDYQALGPKNNEGQVVGGKNLLVGSLEYEYKILEKWSLAVFYDKGNAFNNIADPLKPGTGVGLRWYSPVGLLRLDLATALHEEGHPLRLHIIIGPDL